LADRSRNGRAVACVDEYAAVVVGYDGHARLDT
jgi:hypothetical protein